MLKKPRVKQRRSLPAYKKGRRTKRSLRSKIVLGFLAVISITSLILLILPYLPHLGFLFHQPRIDATPYKQAAKNKTLPPSTAPGNRLILPEIGVDAQIIDGRGVYVIGKNQGVWRENGNISPETPGNLVIAGHRFLYTATNGGYFYNLPELKRDSEIFVKWKDKVYGYEIYNTRTVLPTQVDIRNNDPSVPRKLTLYTCYPLGSTAKRYVVEARLIE